MKNKLRIGIIGSGNIGTDLLVKIARSENLTCSIFIGRNERSPGLIWAKNLGVENSSLGIDSILKNPSVCDVVVDCTSAEAHKEHWKILKNLGITVLDMTPAKLGDYCVPTLASEGWLSSGVHNINMVTCGGQASIPIANALAQVHKEIEYLEVASSISSISAGPATRDNLDEYVETTGNALQFFSGAKKTKAILILNPAVPPINMVTTIYASIHNPDSLRINEAVKKTVQSIQAYCPGYQLLLPPIIKNNIVTLTIKVIGAGDYLPQYAGNLDIINSAAIEVLELMHRVRR
jgi:acetaldehyde dehydrogenase (acetylating)